MRLRAWSHTDTGRRREHNEDSFLAEEELGLFAVADGMGGHRGGARASKLALEVLSTAVQNSLGDLPAAAAALAAASRAGWPELAEGEGEEDFNGMRSGDTLDLSILEENIEAMAPAMAVMRLAARKSCATVFAAAAADSSLRGMGTTMTGMLYDAGRMHLVHVGDSRAYLCRNGDIRRLTRDHSWISEQVMAGAMTEEEARESQFRHVITRSIGFERDVEVEGASLVVHAGDCFLLCSDGLSNCVEEGELEALMARHWYGRLPEVLVDLANERGGDDNITVVVVCAANHLT